MLMVYKKICAIDKQEYIVIFQVGSLRNVKH